MEYLRITDCLVASIRYNKLDDNVNIKVVIPNKLIIMKGEFLDVVVLVLFIREASSIDPSQCIAPLGMENGGIKDQDITASSSFDSGNVGPHNGRVAIERNGGAWCPSKQATTQPEEWLQIDLKTIHMITATGTQGRFGNGQGVEYAEAYILEYWRPRLSKWIRYKNLNGEEILDGNINTYLEAKNELHPPIWASKIRFYPYSLHQRTVCMRVEVYGCTWTDGIVSYSMPQGERRGAAWEFFDSAYDGHWDGDELKHGLGLLTDGKFGRDDFKLSFNDNSPQWVGWKNDTRANRPIVIKFEFDKVREFSAVHIYCNNQFTKDVEIFNTAKIWFSVGGTLYKGEPITYEYIEDKIFETSRNVTIKLHHHVGKYVKLHLHFASRWILISEITFDSVVAHGNFSVEKEVSATSSPVKTKTSYTNTKLEHKIEIPVSSSKISEPPFLIIILSGLVVIIVILVAILFLVMKNIRNRNFLRRDNALRSGFPSNSIGNIQPDSVFGLTEKGNTIEAYGITEIDDSFKNRSITRSSLRSAFPLPSTECDDLSENHIYEEPYRANNHAPSYNHASIMIELQDVLPDNGKKSIALQADTYDYAIPESGILPLLGGEKTLPLMRTRIGSVTSPGSRILARYSHSEPATSKKTVPAHQNALIALKNRLEELSLPEYPMHRLRMLSKLSEGAFGTVYIAEADGIAEYSSTISLGKRLVALKFLGDNASEKERKDFNRDVRILAALENPNVARVLGICNQDDQVCAVMEYLEHGDLCQFLKNHIPAESSIGISSYSVKTLSVNCLLFMGAQIASGMTYLESLNFVHQDLATRNCLVGKAYQIKICDFGTYNDVYKNDYYKVDGNAPLPIRWMAWESVFQGKFTSKSDVWAFAVLLWEILTFCICKPYDCLSDSQVIENLKHLRDCDNGQYMYLPRPVIAANNKDVYDLLTKCWHRNEVERPSFREIHTFLQNKI